jgi:tetratricopeptide (TPR) repeat protein
VYVALLDGNRLVAESRFDEARAAYLAVAKAHPDNWQVRYRLAYLEFARGRYDDAAAGLRAIVDTRSRMPRWLKAAALLNLARVEDIAGNRGEAVRLYKRVVDDFEDEPPAGAARLGLIAPYQAPRVPRVPRVPEVPEASGAPKP